MRRRQRLLSKRQWLAQVKPLMEAPDTPPRPLSPSDIGYATMPKARRLLAYEYGWLDVLRALNATSSEDPAVLEAWIKQDRLRRLDEMMNRRPLR